DRRGDVEHHRSVPRLPAVGHRRRRRQILPALARCLCDLHDRHRGAAVAPAGAFHARWHAMTAGVPAREAGRLVARARWHVLEFAFWLAAFAAVVVLPGRHLILTEIAILGLFALSLDLILGYAGIISLGHAAFFGCGAYAAGLLAKHAPALDPVLA